MKKSVGLVVMTMLPKKDGSKVLAAILQRRGTFNTEKMEPESWPGCCQVTCHGRLEEGEDFELGLFNELGEVSHLRWCEQLMGETPQANGAAKPIER